MKLVISLVALLSLSALAEGQNINHVPVKPVVIAPVPSSGSKDMDLKKHILVCAKTKGVEKLCIPAHKNSCLCSKE